MLRGAPADDPPTATEDWIPDDRFAKSNTLLRKGIGLGKSPLCQRRAVRYAKEIQRLENQVDPIFCSASSARSPTEIASVTATLCAQTRMAWQQSAAAEQQATINPSPGQAAIDKLRHPPEPEVGFMLISGGISLAYNVQIAAMPSTL